METFLVIITVRKAGLRAAAVVVIVTSITVLLEV